MQAAESSCAFVNGVEKGSFVHDLPANKGRRTDDDDADDEWL